MSDKSSLALAAPENRGNQAPRQPNGRFVRGAASPNPGGRPKVLGHVQELARQHTTLAIQTLAEIADDRDQPAAARVAASAALLDRGWGKPQQALAISEVPNEAQAERLREAFDQALRQAFAGLAAQAVFEQMPLDDTGSDQRA